MAGSKSIARVIGEDSFAQCAVHEPRLGSAELIKDYDHTVPLEHLAGALAAGHTIVAAPYGSMVAHTRTVDIFPDKLIESRRSAHGVTFGRMLGLRGIPTEATDSTGTMHNIALKPFASAMDAVREMRGYRTLQELQVPTFEPIGIFPAMSGDHVVSLTLKNNDLVSLDRVKWAEGRMVNSEQSLATAESNNRQVKGIAETLAYIHANGVYHPDGQIKNYVANASNKIGVIDTEKQIVEPLGYADAAQLAWQDIEKLVKSLVINNYLEDEGKMFGVGMLANMPLNVVRSSIEELIVHPYLARLEDLSVDAEDRQTVQIENLYDGLVTKFYNDETWPQHFIDVNSKS